MSIEQKYQCIGDCKEKFGVSEWECFEGQPHKVTLKTYYLADAPFMSAHDREKDPDGIMLRGSRTHVHVIPERSFKDETGNLVRVAHPPLLFVKGVFETDNPMFQYYIERAKIDVGYDRWFQAYHTPSQKANVKENQLKQREADVNRKLVEANALLEQVKAAKAAPPARRA